VSAAWKERTARVPTGESVVRHANATERCSERMKMIDGSLTFQNLNSW
jgi:hypothetical protein